MVVVCSFSLQWCFCVLFLFGGCLVFVVLVFCVLVFFVAGSFCCHSVSAVGCALVLTFSSDSFFLLVVFRVGVFNWPCFVCCFDDLLTNFWCFCAGVLIPMFFWLEF